MTSSYHLASEVERLRCELDEALATLEAIRNGEVDALVVTGSQGERVYTLVGADERYRLLVEQMHQGALIVDREAMILYCNGRFAAMVGAPIQQLIGGTLPDFLDMDEEALADLLENDAAEYEAALRTADGSAPIPIFVTGRPLPSEGQQERCIVLTDLRKQRAAEERLRAQEALLRNEALLRLALRAARMGMWNISPEGRVQCSESTISLFGFPHGARPEHLDDFLARMMLEDAQEIRSIVSGDPGERTLTFQVQVDGQEEPRWLEWHCEAIHAGGGRGVMGAVLDVTNRVRVEEELRHANAAKDEFLGIVSHELRTPVTTVAGLSRLLHRQADEIKPEDLQTALGLIAKDAERLQSLIVNMLLLSRLGHELPEMEPVMLSHSIRKAIDDFSARSEQRQVLFECDSPLPPILGHEPWIVQVMENLLSNADKYSPRGQPIEVKVTREGAEVAVYIRDHGDGIPKEDLDRIFEAFERSAWAKSNAPGLGLGLAVCRRLLGAQRGHVRVSLPEDGGGGTEFCFTLPIADIA